MFSDKNRMKLFLLPPLRGKILDRWGDLLAGNRDYYRIIFDPQATSDKKAILKKLSEVLGLGEPGYETFLKKLKEHKSKNSVAIYEHLTWKEVAMVEVNAPDLPGVFIDVGQIRYFPTGAISSHIVGYMGPVSEEEINKNRLLNHPDFKIGRYGLEQALEARLRGLAGVRRMEVNAHGLLVRELSREESSPGEDVRLTLDKRLQMFVGKRLEGQSGSAVLLNIHTGDVVSFVSTPGFNPDKFTYGVSSKYWKELNNNYERPLINKAISNQYPPGSTFKLVVALAALKAGIDPGRTIYCPGYVNLGNTRFNCWKKEGHNHMNMKQAIMHSCNSYFYNISKIIGVDPIAQMAEKFGFGQKFGLLLSGEKSGLLPTRDWKKEKYNVSWQQGDTLNVGIGQGYILATPMQLAVMTSRVATGRLVVPNMVLNQTPEQAAFSQNEFADMQIDQKHLSLVREAMSMVVNVPGGTAFGSRITDSQYSMAGKTGTSQVISSEGLKAIKDNLTPEQLKRTNNHALFVGFGPVNNPKYAIAVVIEHGGGGSKAAAPVARDIMHEAQKLDV
jgi:penicillin-binding protein 2